METERIKNERKLWNRMAKFYDRQQAPYIATSYEKTIKKIIKTTRKTDAVLEIGCGTGLVTTEIAKKIDKITACDISEKMIGIAKTKAIRMGLTNINYNVGDGYNLPFSDKSFDVIICCHLLDIVKEPDSQLKEIYRLLKKDGILITATNCTGEPSKFSQVKLFLLGVFQKIGIVPYCSKFTKTELRDILINSNFSILEEEVLDDKPVDYYIKLRKN